MPVDRYHYTECGLDNVWLENGVTVEDSPYGRTFSIPQARELHQLIADFVVRAPVRLRGQEARFIRVQLDLSQEQFGKLLGVERATVLRWEKARDETLPMAQDLAIRMTWLVRNQADSVVPAAIRRMQESNEANDRPPATIFAASETGWHARPA